MTVLVALIVCLLLDSCNYWMLITMHIRVAIEETNMKVSCQISKNSILFQNLYFTSSLVCVLCLYL